MSCTLTRDSVVAVGNRKAILVPRHPPTPVSQRPATLPGWPWGALRSAEHLNKLQGEARLGPALTPPLHQTFLQITVHNYFFHTALRSFFG